MESRYNIHDFLIEGKKVEKRFAERLLKEDKSSVIKYASKKDDICKHVDLY
jgi:hypothetical protein